MKTLIITIIVLTVIIILGFFAFFIVVDRSTSNGEVTVMETKSEDHGNDLPSDAVGSYDILSLESEIDSLPKQNITTSERQGIVVMREEEKMARDVYRTLYSTWNLQIFSNISASEQTHMQAVADLIDKYNLVDPITNDSVGLFINDGLAKLYNQFVDQGSTSLYKALEVGVMIEDLNIADLQRYIAETDNDDIKLVYSNLLRGSRNHMRAFVKQLEFHGKTYTPQYITEDLYNQIISTPKETGQN